MPLKLKVKKIGDEEVAEVKDGKPVYINDDGSELPFDANQASDKITSLNGEARTHRIAKETAEQKLVVFGDIDPEKAKAALEVVANLESGELLKANKVQEIKDAAVATVKQQYEGKVVALEAANRDLTEKSGQLTGKLHTERLTNAFSTSKYITDKLTLPSPAAQDIFGKFFKVEEDKLVAYNAKGEKVYSPSRPGEEPEFDEALEVLVRGYSYRDAILKGTGNSGGGGRGGGNGNGGNLDDKTISRADFNKLDPTQQAMHFSKGGKVVDTAA